VTDGDVDGAMRATSARRSDVQGERTHGDTSAVRRGSQDDSGGQGMSEVTEGDREKAAGDDLAALLAGARVLHLQPDDQIVIEMDRPLTIEMAYRIRTAFEGRRVAVLDQGVKFDVRREETE
jgi:hypothetical protein